MKSKYITRYKKALFEEIEEGYGVSPDVSDELERLGNKLISSLKKDFEQHPGSKDPHNLLRPALQECLILQERSMKAFTLYNNASDNEREAVLAVFYTIDSVVSDLLKLFLDNWQEAEKPEKYLFPIEWNVAKPLTELIRCNARFTTHSTLMEERLKAAKPAATMPAPSKRPKREATLHNLSAPEVQQLLTEQGLGSIYNKPGEWAAAFGALSTKGILIGTAPAVYRWAVKENYVHDNALSTLKKAWGAERSEAAQFTDSSQRSVFRNVSDAVEKILIINRLRIVNK